MTRTELIRRVHKLNPGITLQQAEKSVHLIFQEIGKALASGSRVELRGFGVFLVRQRKERHGHNPRTGNVVEVNKKFVPFFKAGKQLRERVNK